MRSSRRSFLLFVFWASAALAGNNQLRSQSSTPSPPNRNIKITNNCPEGLYPAIIGSGGTPLRETGFYLASNDARTVSVPSSWAGRVWARTNCTFDGNGRGHCSTGDCDKKLVCGATSGEKPHTIAEFTVAGPRNETYYDISTVDGYNVDMAIIPEESAGAILSCVSNPEKGAPHWCPYELLLTPPKERSKSDDDIPGDYFSPCHSACSKWGRDQDCCSGKYDDPRKCKPGLYSKLIKSVCPDAYSFAYDDLSTFALPSGLGFEVVFCPDGKSSIVSKSKEENCNDSDGAVNTQGSQSKSDAEDLRSPREYRILLSFHFWFLWVCSLFKITEREGGESYNLR